MISRQVGGVQIDQCESCGGIWFDTNELSAIIPSLLASGKVEPLNLDIIFEKPKLSNNSDQRQCPRCDTPMNTFNYCYDSNIMLDKCSGCNGLWVDGGEMKELLSYVKGHPKLDKLGSDIAKNVADKYENTQDTEDLASSMAIPFAGASGGAWFLAAMIEMLWRWKD